MARGKRNRSRMSIARARAYLRTRGFGRRRRSSGGGGGLRSVTSLVALPHFGGGSGMVEVGAAATIGGVVLSSLFKLPWWLSPIGLALIAYGWWKKNNLIRMFGMAICTLGIVDAMGVPQAIKAKFDDARSKGFLSMFSRGGGGGGGGSRAALPNAGDVNDAVNRAAKSVGDAARTEQTIENAVNSVTGGGP